MRVLITGCEGQIGCCLTQQFAKNDNVTVLAFDRAGLDITCQDEVYIAVDNFKPTIIINAAAYTAVDKAEDEIELSFAVNSDGPKFLAQAAQRIGAAILHISSDYVFEGSKTGEYEEIDTTGPQGVYGESKLAGEIFVASECEKYIIIRTSWVFGVSGNNFVKTMIRLGSIHNELSIVGDQFGGPTFAGDIANALVQIAKRISEGDAIEYGIYHYSGLPHVSWYEFAETIFDKAYKQKVITNKPCLNNITTDQYPTHAKRPKNSRLSTKKITCELFIEASDWEMALNNIQEYVG